MKTGTAQLREQIQQKAPEWWAKLESGIPLPPEPPGGWSRWWRDWGGYVWFLLIASGLQLILILLEEAGHRTRPAARVEISGGGPHVQ